MCSSFGAFHGGCLRAVGWVLRFRFRSAELVILVGCDIGGGWRGLGDRFGRGRGGSLGRDFEREEIRYFWGDISKQRTILGCAIHQDMGEMVATHG